MKQYMNPIERLAVHKSIEAEADGLVARVDRLRKRGGSGSGSGAGLPRGARSSIGLAAAMAKDAVECIGRIVERS
jgi:hypothetical protein